MLPNLNLATFQLRVCNSVRKRKLDLFRSYRAEGTADLGPKIWEAARATSAATTFFDPMTIGRYGQEFVDGGGKRNNPIQETYDEVQACFPCEISNAACRSELERANLKPLDAI